MIEKILLRFKFYYYRIFSKLVKSKYVRTKESGFWLRTGTEHEVHRALTFRGKEPETLAWIDRFSAFSGSNDFVFFDVGANVGIYSLYAASRYSDARIFSFEPDSQSFASLCQNIHANRFKITPYPFAISDGSGVGKVKLSSLSAGAGACALGEKYQFTNKADADVFEQGVFFSSLDELVSRHRFPAPNFIKIDVDGIESTILRGAENVLRSSDCRGVLVEFQYRDEADLAPMTSYLASLGFVLMLRSDWVSGFGALKSRNYIFEKK